MAHVYQGNPDGRQSSDPQMATTMFRPRYRALTDEEKALHDEIKNKAQELANLYGQIDEGRYNSLAMTSLEQSVMWIIKQLTA
jgi:hypothetical protein